MLQHDKPSNKCAKDNMVENVPVAIVESTVKDVEKTLFENAASFHTVDYVYITDKNRILKGILSIKQIIGMSEKNIPVEDVMEKKLIFARPSTPKERLVYQALSHGIRAIPILDKEGHFLGVVPYNAILQIFNEEVREDAFKFGGVFHKVGKEITTITSPLSVMVKARLPWLVLGTVGGSLAAAIVSSFETVLEKYLTLAAFIPVLVYLSDAAGTQSETLIVRGLALDPKLSLRKYLIRELKIAIVLATTCGALLGLVSFFGWGNPFIGAIIAISMFLTLVSAVLISTLLPLLFLRFNADPAVASGPFATMISDITTIIIYFMVATGLLQYFGLL